MLKGKKVLDHSKETMKTIRRVSIAVLGLMTMVVWKLDPGKQYTTSPVGTGSNQTPTTIINTSTTSPSTTNSPISASAPTTVSPTAAPTTQAPPPPPAAVSGGS